MRSALFVAAFAAAAGAPSGARADDFADIFAFEPSCRIDVQGSAPFLAAPEVLRLTPGAAPVVIDLTTPAVQVLLQDAPACGLAFRYEARRLAGFGRLNVELRRGAAVVRRDDGVANLDLQEGPALYGVCRDDDCFERAGEIAYFFLPRERGVERWRLTLSARYAPLEVVRPRLTWVGAR